MLGWKLVLDRVKLCRNHPRKLEKRHKAVRHNSGLRCALLRMVIFSFPRSAVFDVENAVIEHGKVQFVKH